MPQRFLRPGITTSDKWNKLGWFEQSLYIRLLTLVDDAGRYDGRDAIIHAHCFPLRDDVIRQQTAAGCEQLAAVGLIEFYEHDGKRFLQFTNWQERVRNKSKWPEPKSTEIIGFSSIRQPTAADSCQNLPPSPSPSPSPSPAPLAHTRQPDANVPTWDEVKQLAQMRGVPESSAKTFFDHHEGNSLWINQHGKLINWQHKLTSWATTDRQPKPNHASSSTNQPTTPNRNAGTFNDKPLSAAARAKVL